MAKELCSPKGVGWRAWEVGSRGLEVISVGSSSFQGMKASGESSPPQKVLQLLYDRRSQTILDEVILTPLFLLDRDIYIYIYIYWRGLGSDSRCFLLAWSEMLGVSHLHVGGL